MAVGIRILEQTPGNVIALEVADLKENQGQVPMQTFQEVEMLFKEKERLHFLLLVWEVEDWRLDEFWTALQSRTEYYSKLHRIAVVGESKLQSIFSNISSNPSENFFDISRLDEAWEWITAQENCSSEKQ